MSQNRQVGSHHDTASFRSRNQSKFDLKAGNLDPGKDYDTGVSTQVESLSGSSAHRSTKSGSLEALVQWWWTCWVWFKSLCLTGHDDGQESEKKHLLS
jgi:hypothetical protein